MESPELGRRHQHDDLELLLTPHQQEADRVLETPPSPDHTPLPYAAAFFPRTRVGRVRLSVRVRGGLTCLLSGMSSNTASITTLNLVSISRPCASTNFSRSPATTSTQHILDKFSGLRIRNHAFTPAALQDKFSNIRFLRLPAIK
ncbi:hypothetical protein MLD38_023424 [Melastoma candidum]|uniref:Uncharacterized protein n=1 Tax=Melastoma candidum TaxID=119954 RepID=A0ACB9QN03_9MYRT|nr:hypothetical protein MLD38_023424 [Melastoma candidum]